MTVPVSWTPKDPDEVVNYSLPWVSQMADGDTIVGSLWTDITGAVLEADDISDDALSTLARISGGVDGVVASFTNTITTFGIGGEPGETLEQIVLLPIVATSNAPLGEYETPRPQDLTARYPAFAAVPYVTIAIYINDALGGVDTSWNAADYEPAISALAAHNMSLMGLGDEGDVVGYRRQGVSSLRDGAFSVSFNDRCVGAASSGTLDATPYGRAYKVILRRNKAGPRLVGGGVPYDGWGPLAQQNNGVIIP